MPASARDIAAELRRRLPSLPLKKQHKLLYYCQGHHLAAFGQPLFAESISAWDMGPVVGALWKEEKDGQVLDRPSRDLDEDELNTIGYVLSRYGAMTGTDLERLSHHEPPYLRADAVRHQGGRVRIQESWLTEFFGSAEAFEEGADLPPLADLRRMTEGAEQRRSTPGVPDDVDGLRARLGARA